MQEEKPQTGKSQRPSMKDISHILKGWEYEAGTINVRRITGNDGQPKLQMRLDLGLLQMEMDGRPDGVRPHGCQSLREEALMYYHRYLSLFVLGEFLGVARDTARNLRVLDLCGKYASSEQDRLVLEQYRPYIIMMNARALASIEFDENNFRRALAIVKRGLKDIREFFARFGQEDAYTHSNEVKILRRFGREIRRKLPVDPMKQLQLQ